MFGKTITASAIIICSFINFDTPAYGCQKLSVVSTDGYSNIRSQPKVEPGNIIVSLVAGSGVNQIHQNQRWIQVDQPVKGWIAKSQVENISCNRATEILINSGLPVISTLNRQAIEGNLEAANTIIKMASGVDGITAEAYAIEISTWATANPNFLFSALEKQPKKTRQSFFDLLDFGLGDMQSSKRKKFEEFLGRLPQNNPLVLQWKCQDRLLPKSAPLN